MGVVSLNAGDQDSVTSDLVSIGFAATDPRRVNTEGLLVSVQRGWPGACVVSC